MADHEMQGWRCCYGDGGDGRLDQSHPTNLVADMSTAASGLVFPLLRKSRQAQPLPQGALCSPSFGYDDSMFLFCSYIYIIYTPNLGLGIAVFDWEREQGRFRGSTRGVRGSKREY